MTKAHFESIKSPYNSSYVIDARARLLSTRVTVSSRTVVAIVGVRIKL